MIIADCTLIAHLFIDTADTELARAVLRADDDWVAPSFSLWASEFRSVLTRSDQRLTRLCPTLALTPAAFAAP